MSILGDIIRSISSAISDGAAEQFKTREYRDQVMDAVNKSSEDGTITCQEIQEIKSMIDKIGLDEKEMNHVKLKVLKDLTNHILTDNQVSTDEMALLAEIEDVIDAEIGEDAGVLRANLEKIRALYKQ